MGTVGFGLTQIAFFIGFLGVLGLPFFVWRVPPRYYWRCPQCSNRNSLEFAQCGRCDHVILRDELHAHVRADWRARDLIALYLTAQIGSFAIAVLLLMAMGRMPKGSATVEELWALFSDQDVVWTLVITMGAALGLLSIWMVTNRFRWTFDELGLHGRDWRRHVGMGAAAGAVVFAASLGVSWVSRRVGLTVNDMDGALHYFPAQVGDPLWVLILPATLFLLPLSGELFFHGMLYRLFRQRWTLTTAVIVTAALFAVAVRSYLIVPVLPLLLLGAMNASLFERTRSLVPGMSAWGMQGALMFGWAMVRSAQMAG